MAVEYLYISSLLLFIFSSLCFVILFNINQRSTSTTKPKTHNLRAYPLLGYLPHLIRNLPRIVEWLTELLLASPAGTVVLPPFIFTTNPENVEYTAKTNFKNYQKGEDITAAMHDLIGHGILNVNGDEWKTQRKLSSYDFNAKSLRSYILNNLTYQIDARLLPFLRDASSSGQVLDFQQVLGRFVFDNICKLMLGEDPDCLCRREGDGEQFFHAFEEATRITVKRGLKTAVSIWPLMKLLSIGSERRLRKMMAIVHQHTKKSGNFLERLADNEHIHDIRINFLVAGIDTTPAALTWFFWSVLFRPDVLQKIQEEIKTIRSKRTNNNNTAVSAFMIDELHEMNYLHAAISESQRLYPSLPLLARKALEDDVLPDGTEVKKGWTVMYHTYAMARTESIWGEDCREFRPERWLQLISDENGGTYNKYMWTKSQFEYPVFHAGPRMCLGKDMAYLQMKTVAARVLEVFELEMVEERGEHQMEVTFTMKGGLPVKIKERTTK